jgi:P27 family predicted phage terminase small subunit
MAATVTQIAIARDAAPQHLGDEGRRLWRDVLRDHGIDDAAGRALLMRACEALDRLRQVQAVIAADGITTKGYRGQVRPHPLLSTEAEQSRILLATFRALNLDMSP